MNEHNSPSVENEEKYEDWTNEQLYERVQDLDLEGRSDMDKPELISLLRGKRYGDQN